MNIQAEKMFDQIASLVLLEFPGHVVRVETVPESPATRAIAVYGVTRMDHQAVRAFINRLDCELCTDLDIVALARVVSLENTAEYYPDFMPKPPATAAAIHWHSVEFEDHSLVAANEELALAA